MEDRYENSVTYVVHSLPKQKIIIFDYIREQQESTLTLDNNPIPTASLVSYLSYAFRHQYQMLATSSANC